MDGMMEGLELGWCLLQAGEFSQAEQIFRRILQYDQSNAQVFYFLGVANQFQGRHGEAMARYQQALRMEPNYPEAHNNLGSLLQALGRYADAEASYREALRLKSNYPEAHINVGIVLAGQGRLAEAVANFQQALLLKPDCPEAHFQLGNALRAQAQLSEAIDRYQQALHIKPNYPEARVNLGIVLETLDRCTEAVSNYQQALRLKPDCSEAHFQLGNALRVQGQPSEAVDSYQRALQLNPNYPEAHVNLGIVQETLERQSDAVASYQQALCLKPNYREALINLGSALREQGKLEEAMASFQQALRHRPDDAEAHWNRALLWLLLGNFEQGWPEYEWRWKCKHISPHPLSELFWDGSRLDGRTILLDAEQGLGDTLQFIRYATQVQERGGRVIARCQPPLRRLLATCPGIDQVIAQGESLPELDVVAPLMSLPALFGTTLESLPAEIPYLFVDAALETRWRQELGMVHAFKVGIAWQGNRSHHKDRHRSIPLARFEPLSQLTGVQLFSLQTGPRAEQLQEVIERFSVIDLGAKVNDFMDTAAIMKNLDLIITVDTSIAHLAGALGVPAWVAVPFAPDWRWLLEREDSPWYPTLRLFRQQRRLDWDDVFGKMTRALQARLSQSRQSKALQTMSI